MNNKYTLKRAFQSTITGYEKVVWNVMDGDFVVDTFSLKRDAKYYMDRWNSEATRNAPVDSGRPAYYDNEGGSMCNGLGRSYF